MTIHTIGPTRVVVYFTPAELRDRGCTAETLDEERAAPLVRRALREEGIAAEGKMEIVAFPSDCGLRLFVHRTPPGRQWFSFGGLEELLAAARGGGVPPEDAVLCWYGDRWWLSLPPAYPYNPTLLFFPFGRWWAAGRSFPFSKASSHGAVGCKV